MVLDQFSGVTAPGDTNILQNFSDATAGSSQQVYFGMAATDSAGVEYVLDRTGGTSRPTTITTTTSFDIDFDITINKPTIFAGLGFIDLHFGIESIAGSATSVDIDFEIIHYDGTTETVLASVDTVTITNSGSITEKHKLRFNVPRKLFGIGHILRLNAKGTNTSAANGRLELRIDPNTAGNELKLNMPIVNLE